MKQQENKPTLKKQAWPTKAAMKQVYEKQLWGGNNTAFYSGEGSHHSVLVDPYLEVVTSFLQSFKTPITLCDFGCGDFNVGKQLVQYTHKYEAVDIVEELIAYNISHFQAPNLTFHCLDIAIDKLPTGDCVLLRQVLQHLSNAEVESIVRKLSKFKYVILTEHLPTGEFTPNNDIISGQGVRLKKQSGIRLMEPPFNFVAKAEEQLLSITLQDGKSEVVTTLYTVF